MALAFRPEMKDARLGLGFILLQKSRFTQAADQFQAVLDSEPSNVPALIGRGVARYEEALAGSDQLLRSRFLTSELDDFEGVLKLAPSSPEAGYNRIWALFQSGRHVEALSAIDRYLSLDPSSLWAEKLRGLRTKIRATRSGTVDEDVDRAAVSRNAAPLQAFVTHASYAVPAAIRSALRRSLELEGASIEPGKAGPRDLVWAAQALERAYSSATGDRSCMALLQFYQGLSPSRRAIKKNWI